MPANKMPPVPYQTPLVDENKEGKMPNVWSDWFRELLVRVGGPVLPSTQSSSGYEKLPSGFYIQWGITGSVASGATQAVTFPKTFPTNVLQVIVGLRNMSGAATSETGHYGTGTYSASGFEIFNRTSAAYVFNWLAVGY